MSKRHRPANRGEARLLSRIESSRDFERRLAMNAVQNNIDEMSNAIASKLIENNIVETNNKGGLEEQIKFCLESLLKADDFQVDYQIAPVRSLVTNPNIVSLYVTAFIIEKLLDHKDIIDIYGTDEDIYFTVNRQVTRFIKY